MCTLSYLPLKKGFFVVNNRDESPLRAATFQPEPMEIDGVKIMAPIDATVKGTWIGINEAGRMVCLMNGAFENHVKKPLYRKSRGKVTLEFLTNIDAIACFEASDFHEIEPFTLIIIDQENIKVFRWDEVKKHVEILDKDVPHNWSSSTLYEQKVAESRAEYFLSNIQMFIEQKEKIIAWHKDEIQDSPKIILDRPQVKTISITTIHHNGTNFEMVFHDLVNQNTFETYLNIKQQQHEIH